MLAEVHWGVKEISQLIEATRFHFNNELDLQDRIEDLLVQEGVPYTREVVLSRTDRIDFMSGDIGIEVKIGSSMLVVQRQMWRYAFRHQISSLILVTTCTKHKAISR